MASYLVHCVGILLFLAIPSSGLLFDVPDSGRICDDQFADFETLMLSDVSGQPKPMFTRHGQPVLVREISLDTVDCPDYAGLSYDNFSVNFIDATDELLKNSFKLLAKNPPISSSSLLGKYNLVMSFGDDPQLTSNLQLESNIQTSCTPRVIVKGCEPIADYCIPRCMNGGQCVGFNKCSCPPGFDGQLCEDKFTKPEVFNMTFGQVFGLTVMSVDNVFNFPLSGDIKYATTGSFKRSPHGGPHDHHGHLHVYHEGGTAHCKHHDHDCNDIFHAHPHGAYTSSGNFVYGHNHNGHTTIYSTHQSPDHLGASLEHNHNTLTMNVNNGHVQCRLDAPHGMQSGQQYSVVSSFSPNHGCSMFVNGHHIGSSAPKPRPSQHGRLQAPQTFCMGGHCTTHYQPNSQFNASISNPMFVAESIQNLINNGLASLLGGVMGSMFKSPPTTTTARPTVTTRPTTARPVVTARTTPAPVTTTALPALISSPICYDCGPMDKDGQCKNVKMCPSGEICMVFEDHGKYTHSCLDRTTCLTAAKTVTSGCWECCTGYLCNQQCPGAPCSDTSVCSAIQKTGYDVCKDQSFAQNNCQKTCNLCSTSG